MTLHNQCKCRGLHPAYWQDIPRRGVLKGIKPGPIHAQYPVAYSTRKPGIIQIVKLLLWFKSGESLSYSIVSQRWYPQTAHRTFHSSLLHHPSLYQFSLLSGITAVDYLISLSGKGLYHVKLSFIGCFRNKFYPKFRRDHR